MKRVLFGFLNTIVVLFCACSIWAQPAPGVYLGADGDRSSVFHEVKINNNYLIHSVYKPSSCGIWIYSNNRRVLYSQGTIPFIVDFEFNSNYAMIPLSKPVMDIVCLEILYS